MGLLRVIDKRRAEKCKKEKLEQFDNLYLCKEGRCLKNHDKGITYCGEKVCNLLTYESNFEIFVNNLINEINCLYRIILRNPADAQKLPLPLAG